MVDITIKITALACDHLIFDIYVGTTKVKTVVRTLAELRIGDSEVDSEDKLIVLIKDTILANPNKTRAQLKTIIEGKVFHL